jgi:DNA-binding response OmpR family regulator
MQDTLQGKRLLLIEDSLDIQAFVGTVARLEGAILLLATTGEEGLEALKLEPPVHLVLVDLNLPGIQGWDVLQEINSEAGLERPAVVIFSAFMDEPTRERAAEMGAIGFIAKPVGARDLVEQLEAFLSLNLSRRHGGLF